MKFRVYSIQQKRYLDGSFYLNQLGELFIITGKRTVKLNLKLFSVEFSTDAFEYDNKYNKGKEMFQGDVVTSVCFDDREVYTVIIENFKKLPDEITGSKCNSRQIIGNIHEGRQ